MDDDVPDAPKTPEQLELEAKQDDLTRRQAELDAERDRLNRPDSV